MSDWKDWIGREEHRIDTLTPRLLGRYRATLDCADSGVAAPQGIHWCLCLPDTATADLGSDGHPPKGGFLPPVDLPRRMWASSEVEFAAPILSGGHIERTSRIAFVDEKRGGSGKLVFVAVRHETRCDGVVAVIETQTIVYRDAPAKVAPPPLPHGDALVPDSWQIQRSVQPTAPLLFRYSALTFNTHRIHYDLPYAREEEGYAGLVVHGPLTASLLLDLASRALGPNRLKTFRFRGIAPAYAGVPLRLLARQDGQALTFAAIDGTGREVMTAAATI
jgi:3-methylfumaryl-CoA hydratase